MSSDVAVIGAGAWGTALAIAAMRAGRRVSLWARDAGQRAAMRETRQNDRFLPDVRLPEGLAIVETPAEAAEAAVLLFAVPTQALHEVAAQFAQHLRPGTAVIGAAKGIERGSGRFVGDILREALPGALPALLSGPSFAADVSRALPTAVALAARDATLAERLAGLLGSPGFRIYHTDDLRGVEIGGAAKNVLAIAAGIVAGAGLGESARAAIVTRGFAELRRFAIALGARPETLMGLSGLGDLLLTASSPQSRNFSLGLALGRGEEPPAGKLAEGVFTAPVLNELAKRHAVEMPICLAVEAVVTGKAKVSDAIENLTSRPQRGEA